MTVTANDPKPSTPGAVPTAEGPPPRARSSERGAARMPALLVLVATLLGAALALAAPDTPSAPKPDAPASASARAGAGDAGAASPETGSVPTDPSAVATTSASAAGSASSAPSAAPAAPTTASASPTPVFTSGYAPLPAGSAVPKAWLPPGADSPDPGPSRAIFPAQRITVRFNHQRHVVDNKLACTYCHSEATKSTKASDWLLPPKHDLCTDCHAIDESDPFKDDSPPARCDACHINAQVAPDGKVTVKRVQIPTPNLKMSHKAHFDKGIVCATCHGAVQNLELATRDQLPRMKGCFSCHQSGDAGGLGKMGNAKGACATCHITEKDGVLKTMFASGVLMPPRWLRNASHGPDWIERHRRVAGSDSKLCASCHREQECNDCHDGKTRPRSVHPSDYLNMHAIDARFDDQKCASCHSTTNFCVPCHTRVGVSPASPSRVATPARFHPPPAVWSGALRRPGHHSFEAQKNMNACVSCHVERDCVVCHGTQNVGGQGSNPHGSKFSSRCATMYAKNPRPCFVCHAPGDRELDACR